MSVRGCCPPLARPRTHLGSEIIGFDPKTGQFVQAAAGLPRITQYPYFASAGVGSSPALGSALATTLWIGIGVLAVVSLATVFKELKETG